MDGRKSESYWYRSKHFAKADFRENLRGQLGGFEQQMPPLLMRVQRSEEEKQFVDLHVASKARADCSVC